MGEIISSGETQLSTASTFSRQLLPHLLSNSAALTPEQALPVVINGVREFTLYRSPGHDGELALGLLYSLGRIASLSQVKDLSLRRNPGNQEEELCVELGTQKPEKLISEFGELAFSPRLLPKMASLILQRTELNPGHMGMLFDPEGNLHLQHQDVDPMGVIYKLLGASLLMNQVPLNNYLLVVDFSLRGLMVQLCRRVGIRVMVTLQTATQMACFEAADDVTLIGRLTTWNYQIYSGKHRLQEAKYLMTTESLQ